MYAFTKQVYIHLCIFVFFVWYVYVLISYLKYVVSGNFFFCWLYCIHSKSTLYVFIKNIYSYMWLMATFFFFFVLFIYIRFVWHFTYFYISEFCMCYKSTLYIYSLQVKFIYIYMYIYNIACSFLWWVAIFFFVLVVLYTLPIKFICFCMIYICIMLKYVVCVNFY